MGAVYATRFLHTKKTNAASHCYLTIYAITGRSRTQRSRGRIGPACPGHVPPDPRLDPDGTFLHRTAHRSAARVSAARASRDYRGSWIRTAKASAAGARQAVDEGGDDDGPGGVESIGKAPGTGAARKARDVGPWRSVGESITATASDRGVVRRLYAGAASRCAGPRSLP